MTYSDEILKKVKSFGALQYDLERIIAILQPDNADQFRSDFADKEGILYSMWQSGFLAGQYNLDAQQFELKKAEAEKMKVDTRIAEIKLKNLQDYQELKHEMFGV